MTTLLNYIASDIKNEKKIIEQGILFITHNKNLIGNSVDFPKEVKDLGNYIIGDENKLEFELRDQSSNNSNSKIKNQSIYEIYNSIQVYSSDYCGLGKSFLIKKEIKNKGEEYHYLSIGDDIVKDNLFRKLKRFFKIEL